MVNGSYQHPWDHVTKIGKSKTLLTHKPGIAVARYVFLKSSNKI